MKNNYILGGIQGTGLILFSSSSLLVSKKTIVPDFVPQLGDTIHWSKDWGEIKSKRMKIEDVKFIVLHSTSVDADAEQVCNSMGCRQASWHYTVDANHIINSYPLTFQAWHVGDADVSLNGCTNKNSIAIEMCQDRDQIPAAVVNSTRQLLRYLKIYFPNAILCRHNDVSGKICPLLIDEETFLFLKAEFEGKKTYLKTPFNEKRKKFLGRLGDKVKLIFK